jgi:rod shape-determining protein MreC
MLDIFSRYRQLTLLAGVVFAQVLLLAFQIRRDHEVRLIRLWAVEVVTPAGEAGTWSLSKIGGIWSGYIGLHGAHAENARLQDKVNQLQLQNRELENRAAEADRLSVLLNFKETHTEALMLAAQVIEASADDTSHTIFINRGERDHVRRNLAVITPDGIVGKIVEVFPATSQVLLLNDKYSGVGALLGDTRTHGVVEGNGGPAPIMDYVVNDEKVHAGEQILTSGEDRIFPKDFPIGTVESAKPANPFQVIRVQPSARLDRLEEVLVLLTQQEIVIKKPEPAASAPASDGTAAATPAPGAAPAKAAAAKSAAGPQ